MAEIISDDILDSAYEEVAGYSDDQARSAMERLSKAQPALLAFVMASTEDLDTEAQELAIYMFAVIHKAFEKQFGKRLQNAGIKRVEEVSDSNEKAIEELIGREDDLLDAAVAYTQNQPALFRYVSECLGEPDEDDVELSEADQGVLTVTMKTVIDVLDSSVRAN